MLKNYNDPETCRMIIICYILSRFETGERGRPRLAEIDEKRFHESFRRALLMLADQRLAVENLFHWDRIKHEYKEVRIALRVLIKEGALHTENETAFIFRPENCRAVFEKRWKGKELSDSEHTKLTNAALYAMIAYTNGISFEKALLDTNSIGLTA